MYDCANERVCVSLSLSGALCRELERERVSDTWMMMYVGNLH